MKKRHGPYRSISHRAGRRAALVPTRDPSNARQQAEWLQGRGDGDDHNRVLSRDALVRCRPGSVASVRDMLRWFAHARRNAVMPRPRGEGSRRGSSSARPAAASEA